VPALLDLACSYQPAGVGVLIDGNGPARPGPVHVGWGSRILTQQLKVADFVPPKSDPDLGGSYADIGGLQHVRRVTEEQISEKISRRILAGDQGMLVWWSIGAGVHVEPHSHANEQIVWMLKGKMEFRLGSEQRVCGPGDVVVIPGGAEHEAWFREDTQVIDFFAPPREDFLLGGKPAYMSEG
jgi:quercetin dioxygenase-like cupin family protein